MTHPWLPPEPTVPTVQPFGAAAAAPGWSAPGTVLPVAPGRGRRAYLLGSLAAVAGVVVVTAVAASSQGAAHRAAFVPRPLPAAGVSCTTDPAVARDEQGRRYLEAVQAAEPGWERVTASLQAEAGVVHRDDMVAQATADRVFLGGLARVPFSGAGQEPGRRLVARVQEYVALLDAGASQVGYLSAHQADARRLAEQRGEASGELRRALGLPDSTCDVLRP